MRRPALALASLLILLLGVPHATAASTVTAPYDAREEYRDEMDDSLAMGSASLDGYSDPDLGVLSASTTATSTAPVGVAVPNIEAEPNRPINGNDMLAGASWARARMRIVEYFPISSAGTYTIKAQLTDISASTSTTYRHKMIGGSCLCDVLESGFAWARAQIHPFFYPCGVGQSCTGYPIGYQVDLPGSGSLDLQQSIDAFAAGHIAVKISLVSEAFAKGPHFSRSAASFRVANISLEP